MRFSPIKLLHGLLYAAPVLLLTLVACGGGGGDTPPGQFGAAYTLSVNVTGVSGVGVVLRNNGGIGGDDLTVTTPGIYSFGTAVIAGTSYDVTVLTHPSAPVQVCDVTSPSGTMSANVTLAVGCVNAYTIGGTITSVDGGGFFAASGIGPTLQNNSGDNLFIPKIGPSPTPFVFSIPVASGVGYAVTQLSRARSPSQNCAVVCSSCTGIVSGADISNVSITCEVTPVPDPKFAYVTNSTATPIGVDDTVSAYGITAVASGVLATQVTATTGDAPSAVAVELTGQFAYVVNKDSDTVSAYNISSADGTLTAIDANGIVAGTRIATGDSPVSIAIHPSGEFAYVVNQGNGSTTGNTISAYSMNTTTGVLSVIDANGAVTGTQAATGGTWPYSVTIDPTGNFAYVANYTSNNISAYTINQTSGALTTVAGSPFDVGVGTNPSSIAIDPTGTCALVANNTSNDVYSYTIDSVTGALASASIAVASGSGGSAPRSVAVDPATGLYAYVANAGPGPGSVSAFIINPADCTITPTDTDATNGGVNPTILAGTTPISVNVDPSGQFVYVANFGSNDVWVYSIGAGGALTLEETEPAGSGPTSVTTTQ